MDAKSFTNKIAAIVLILLIMVALTSVMMPTLSKVRQSNISANMKRLNMFESREGYTSPASAEMATSIAGWRETPTRDTSIPLAVVSKFDAEINLTPTLSVGTATAESIYIAEFKSTIEARSEQKNLGKSQIALPLPPQIISLADVNVTINGDPSEDFSLGPNCLVWNGTLDSSKNSTISITYSAVGKGIYTLEKPSGKIIELFKTKLTANNGNIQMMDLSLQPNKPEKSSNKSVYTWEYKKLVAARPISIDVLGIASIDRLEKLTWLGPLGVFAFGVLIALIALADKPEKLDGWVIVLVSGCFASAYPLMYFLQDFVSLTAAIGIASGLALCIVGWRILSVYGILTGILGGVILPAIILALTISVALVSKQAEQGVLLTVMAIFAFVVAMMLLPKVQAGFATPKIEKTQTVSAPPTT